MGIVQKARISELQRQDLYNENEVEKIVNAQNARSAQSFPSGQFEDASDSTIYVYAFTSKEKYANINAENKTADFINAINEGASDPIKAAHLISLAEFDESNENETTNRFVGYQPILSGSIKLSFVKKSS